MDWIPALGAYKPKQSISYLDFSKEVKFVKSVEDRYCKTLGYVFVGDDNVNKDF
jgi:hypothetical protein